MPQHLAFVITSLACAGCSLIYNPGNLPIASDAQIDAEIIDPAMLVIDDITPSTIFEGQGELGSPPALVVIHGSNIIDRNTVVQITPVSGTAQLSFGTPTIASNGHWIAVPVTAKVDAALMAGSSVALDVKVTQELPPELGGGTPMATLHDRLALIGLKELASGSQPEFTGNELDITKLQPLYSKVELSADATFVGSARAILHSVSSISSTATLIASGAGGASGNNGGGGGRAAAGGCDGGDSGSKGGCGSSIGGNGGSADGNLGTSGGGGGGGFATDGMTGTGSIAGTGGSGTGDELIVTYDGFGGSSPNRAGGGGGGGGNATLNGKGGGGGAGAGSIELTAGGNLSVASLTADGGTGGAGNTVVANTAAGGGGGAGGLVVLRAGGALATSGAVSVKGGAGGAGAGGNGDGGPGSHGRVRWDAPTGAAPTVPNGTLHRGPSFKLDTQVFRTASPAITVLGTTNDRFDVYWSHAGMTYAGSSYSIGATSATVTPMLRQGFNRLCITLAGGKQGAPEADKCVDVAFLP